MRVRTSDGTSQRIGNAWHGAAQTAGTRPADDTVAGDVAGAVPDPVPHDGTDVPYVTGDTVPMPADVTDVADEAQDARHAQVVAPSGAGAVSPLPYVGRETHAKRHGVRSAAIALTVLLAFGGGAFAVTHGMHGEASPNDAPQPRREVHSDIVERDDTDDEQATGTPTETDRPEKAADAEEKPEKEPAEDAPVVKPETGKQDAGESAKGYVRSVPMSYDGLVSQLEHDGYSHDEAVVAADACGADWNESAARAADDYVKRSGVSADGLRRRLAGDGYTQDQIDYAMGRTSPDWDEEAVMCAERHIEDSDTSREGLRKWLTYEGFTGEQADAAMSKVDADWQTEAVDCARSYLSSGAFSESRLREQLAYEGFTAEQVDAAVSACGADWDAEATKSAKSHMRKEPGIVRSALMSELASEGFTDDQSLHAADSVGL